MLLAKIATATTGFHCVHTGWDFRAGQGLFRKELNICIWRNTPIPPTFEYKWYDKRN